MKSVSTCRRVFIVFTFFAEFPTIIDREYSYYFFHIIVPADEEKTIQGVYEAKKSWEMFKEEWKNVFAQKLKKKRTDERRAEKCVKYSSFDLHQSLILCWIVNLYKKLLVYVIIGIINLNKFVYSPVCGIRSIH